MPEASTVGAVVRFSWPGPDGQDVVWSVQVRPASFMDRAHYLELLREAEEHLREQHGLADPWSEIDDPSLAALRTFYVMRAEALACIPRQARADGTVYLASGPDEELLELPRTWTDIATCAEEMPWAVLEALVQANRQVNPGVFLSAPFDNSPWRIEPTTSWSR